jgi:hypothetical protein
MTGSEQSSWSIVSVPSPDLARTASGAAPVEHSDWVRLFLGASFARCRMGSGSGAGAEYLVSGLRLSDAGPLDDATAAEVAAALGQAFDGLRDVLTFHRNRIDSAQREAERGGDVPYELLLTAYPMLMCVTVSDDPDDWVVTDEGLCIVRWGLLSPRMRPLLQWTDSELQAMRAAVFRQSRLPLGEPGSGTTRDNEVVRGSWDALLTAEPTVPASGVRKPQAPGPPRGPAAKPPAGATTSVRNRPHSKALIWALRVAVVFLAGVMGFQLKSKLDRISTGLSQREQQRSSGSLPMAAQRSSGSLESAPAAQLAGATETSTEVGRLKLDLANEKATRKQVEEGRDGLTGSLTRANDEVDRLKNELDQAKKSQAKAKSDCDLESKKNQKLEAEIKSIERRSGRDRKATELAFALWSVDGKPAATSDTRKLRELQEGVSRAIDILKGQTMAAIDVPLASGWSKKLAETLHKYVAIQVTKLDSSASLAAGFYWCRESDLRNVRSGKSPEELFNNTGKHGWIPNQGKPSFEEVANCPLKQLCVDIPGEDSVASVRELWKWMIKLDSLVVGDPESKPTTVAGSIGSLRLPTVLCQEVVSEALNSVETELTSLSKQGLKPPGVDDALARLKRAKQIWKPGSKASDEPLESLWEKVKSELKTWSAGTASNPEIVFYGVLSVEDGGAPAWGYPMPPLPGSVPPQQGTLYAVKDGKPSRIGTVIDGKPIVAPNAPTDLPDGCPVICVSTSPGAKGPAAADPSK